MKKLLSLLLLSIVLVTACKKNQVNRYKHGDFVYYDNSPNSAPELTNVYRIDSVDFRHTDSQESYAYYATSSNGIDVSMQENQFSRASEKQKHSYQWGENASVTIDQSGKLVSKTDTAYWVNHGLEVKRFNAELYHHY